MLALHHIVQFLKDMFVTKCNLKLNKRVITAGLKYINCAEDFFFHTQGTCTLKLQSR